MCTKHAHENCKTYLSELKKIEIVFH
jgi:hypothetical protein